MAGIVAKHIKQMKFFYSHLTRNIFNLYMRRFFFGLVYVINTCNSTHDTMASFKRYSPLNSNKQHVSSGRGSTLICLCIVVYVRRLVQFFEVQKFEFRYF